MIIQKFFYFILVVISSLTMSFFVFVFVAGLTLLICSLMSWKEFEILLLLAPASASLTWMSTTNILAIKNKSQTIWLSYIVGCLVTFFICHLLNSEVNKTNWENFINIFLSAAIPGFLFCLRLFMNENRKLKQNLFNTLDENL